MSQNIELFIATAVRTSKPTNIIACVPVMAVRAVHNIVCMLTISVVSTALCVTSVTHLQDKLMPLF
jgi:hypothetical protein